MQSRRTPPWNSPRRRRKRRRSRRPPLTIFLFSPLSRRLSRRGIAVRWAKARPYPWKESGRRRRERSDASHQRRGQIVDVWTTQGRRFDFDLEENEEEKDGDGPKDLVSMGKYPWSGTDRDYTYEELLGVCPHARVASLCADDVQHDRAWQIAFTEFCTRIIRN